MSERIEHNGYIIRIEHDQDPESPREWDNLGTMTCFHKRYNLGDKHHWKSDMFDDWDAVEKGIELAGAIIILPLYLMDHSGLTMRVDSSTFRMADSHGWDWGQVGFIHITMEKIRAEYGWKRLSKKRRERIATYLSQEVETYSQYLNGEVYGYVIEDEEGNDIDSCWGFFGYDYAVEQAKEAVKSQQTLSPA